MLMANKIADDEIDKPIQILPPLVPRQRGRPLKYRPDMCDTIVAIAYEGGMHAAMWTACGISQSQFYEWKLNIPAFRDAVEEADGISLAFQEAVLVKGMLGQIKGYNFNANAMILNNKYKAIYSRSGSGDNTEIIINNNTLNLTSDQITQKIAQKLEKFKTLGVDLLGTGGSDDDEASE